jgi:site-specific DNA-adenine methylase
LKNIKKDSKIIGRERELIIERIKQEKDFTDWITLSSSLLFSAKYALDFKTFAAQTFYNKVKQVNYSCDGYLDGLTVVQSDYYNVYLEYKNAPNALFVFDPPYLATDSSTYSSDNYWKLKDYLNVLRTLDGVEYVYFTSEKSSIIELLTWIEKTYNITSPFSGAKKIEIGTQMNHVSRYVDIMLYKISA